MNDERQTNLGIWTFTVLAAWILGNVIKVDDGWDYVSIWVALVLAQSKLTITWRK